jgi:hypothetical protein
MAKFYIAVNDENIVATLTQQLSWSHMVEITKRLRRLNRRRSSGKSSGKITALIPANPNISAPVMVEPLGISQRAVEKQLANLKAAGKLRRNAAECTLFGETKPKGYSVKSMKFYSVSAGLIFAILFYSFITNAIGLHLAINFYFARFIVRNKRFTPHENPFMNWPL